MSAECSGVVLWGFDNRDAWGAVQRRPLQTLYLVHYGVPFLAAEDVINSSDQEWPFPGALIVRPDPADFAYDVAFMVLYRAHRKEPKSFHSPNALSDWHHDPRDDQKTDRRSPGHSIIRQLVQQAPPIRLQVVQFDVEVMLGSDSIKVWTDLGFAVEQYLPEVDPRKEPS